jgi:hypothetical protein
MKQDTEEETEKDQSSISSSARLKKVKHCESELDALVHGVLKQMEKLDSIKSKPSSVARTRAMEKAEREILNTMNRLKKLWTNIETIEDLPFSHPPTPTNARTEEKLREQELNVIRENLKTIHDNRLALHEDFQKRMEYLKEHFQSLRDRCQNMQIVQREIKIIHNCELKQAATVHLNLLTNMKLLEERIAVLEKNNIEDELPVDIEHHYQLCKLRKELQNEKESFQTSYKEVQAKISVWEEELKEMLKATDESKDPKPCQVILYVEEDTTGKPKIVKEIPLGTMLTEKGSPRSILHKPIPADEIYEARREIDKCVAAHKDLKSNTYQGLFSQMEQQEMLRQELDRKFEELTKFVDEIMGMRIAIIEEARAIKEKQSIHWLTRELGCTSTSYEVKKKLEAEAYENSITSAEHAVLNLKLRVDLLLEQIRQKEKTSTLDQEWVSQEIERRSKNWYSNFQHVLTEFQAYTDELKHELECEVITSPHIVREINGHQIWCNTC